MTSYKVLSLIAFAADKSKDYASHWLKRQLKSEVARKPLQRLLTPSRLFPGRGSHSIYIVERDVAEKLVSLFPNEWKWPSKLLDEYFHSSEIQRAGLLLDAYDATSPPVIEAAAVEAGRAKKTRGYIFAAHSEGNGTKLSGVVGNRLRLLKTVQAMATTVRNSYSLVGNLQCKDVQVMKAFLHSRLAQYRVGDPDKEFFEVPPVQVKKTFRALRTVQRRLARLAKKEEVSS